MLNLFNNTMTGRDQWMMSQINALKDSIINYDTVDTTPGAAHGREDRQAAAMRGIASYGQMDGDSHVIEPRQVLKEHAYTTSNVHSKLISPWVNKQRIEFSMEEETSLRSPTAAEHAQTPISHEHLRCCAGEGGV